MRASMRIQLPEPVAAIYRAVEQLEAAYPGRRFTPDGHLVGSIGEVVAAEALGLTLQLMGNGELQSGEAAASQSLAHALSS